MALKLADSFAKECHVKDVCSGKTRQTFFNQTTFRVAFQLSESLSFSIYNATSISNQVLIAIWKIEKQFINKKASMHPKSFKIHFYGAINKKNLLTHFI